MTTFHDRYLSKYRRTRGGRAVSLVDEVQRMNEGEHLRAPVPMEPPLSLDDMERCALYAAVLHRWRTAPDDDGGMTPAASKRLNHEERA